MTKTTKRTRQAPAAPVLREEAWPFVRGKRSHGSAIPASTDSCKLFSNP
ncbi:hypothetical protein HUG20_08925 [Salicibibacter cibi]|uniref:Uncharacterized protein n=1 Tax=Salicibibacter cibi TaxID=2743001 RepID=A0A7T7CFC1_9BACI|nr:hypothetical protein [Salicibibacter cibi]QQK79997.1 hypothetical protein HUG20_08925 [Salicibibacter cibi]